MATDNQIIDAHIQIGKHNKEFFEQLKSLSNEEKNLRWKITVLFYRVFMPMKAYLIKKGTISCSAYMNIDHNSINQKVRDRNELGDSRKKYLSLFHLSHEARYYPFPISHLDESVLENYKEKAEEILNDLLMP